MAKNKFINGGIHLFFSFVLGFLFVLILIFIGIGTIFSKSFFDNENKEIKKIQEVPFVNYEGQNFNLKYPENYQLNENKIVATEGIIIDQKNTIQLISPPLNENGNNLSMIITFMPYTSYVEDEEKNQSTTCPELYQKKLDPVKIGGNTFTTSGQIFCGPDEVAFFYLLKNDVIYEVKVETTADYEMEALPEIKNILKMMAFEEN